MSEYLNIGLDITGLLDNSPTHGKGPALIMCRGIEYMPVRHSTWKEVLAGMDYEYECTRCKTCVEQRYPYCPNCGSRMDRKAQKSEE